MTILHISETEAIRDFAAVLAHVRAGSEVVIDGDSSAIALLVPPAEPLASDHEHDLWFRSKVQQALDEPSGDLEREMDEQEIEDHFALRRRSATLIDADATR